VGFRSGILIGVLVTTVVALGVTVALLATNDSSEATKTETVARVGPSCQLKAMGGEVEIEASSEDLGCAESRGIYTAYKEAVRSGEAAGIGRSSSIEGWRCQEYPLAEYPLIVRCRRGAQNFDVVGLAPAAHTNQPPPALTSPAPAPLIFQTPSGNIGCQVASAFVRCDIFDRSWSPPPKPEDCAYEWGHSIALHRKGSTFLCTGDAVISPGGESGAPILPYGKTVGRGPFACESREQALVCVAKSGHGFLLSFQKLRLF
jgi:hypothetical protein